MQKDKKEVSIDDIMQDSKTEHKNKNSTTEIINFQEVIPRNTQKLSVQEWSRIKHSDILYGKPDITKSCRL